MVGRRIFLEIFLDTELVLKCPENVADGGQLSHHILCTMHYGRSFLISSKNYFLISNKLFTRPIAEIIWVKNVRAIMVCGFLMK